MIFKKIKMYLLVGSLLIILSIPIAPLGDACRNNVPSLCGLVSNFVILVGGLIHIKSEIENFILPGTDVFVEFDNGEIKKGILTAKGASGRPVHQGDKLRLNCLKSFQSSTHSKLKTCELEFFGFDQFSSCSKGSPCYGKIPSWSISVDENGVPDSNLIRIHQ